MTRSLLTIAPLSMLLACEPIDPTPPGGEHPSTERAAPLAAGVWSIELTDPVVTGDCGELDPWELDGTLIEARIATPGAAGVVIDLDEFVLAGDRVGANMQASGFMPMEGGVEPHPDDDDVRPLEEDDGEDVPPPGAGPEEDEPVRPDRERGIELDMVGEIDSPELIFGEMAMVFDYPGMACEIELAFDAEFVGEDRDSRPPCDDE